MFGLRRMRLSLPRVPVWIMQKLLNPNDYRQNKLKLSCFRPMFIS